MPPVCPSYPRFPSLPVKHGHYIHHHPLRHRHGILQADSKFRALLPQEILRLNVRLHKNEPKNITGCGTESHPPQPILFSCHFCSCSTKYAFPMQVSQQSVLNKCIYCLSCRGIKGNRIGIVIHIVKNRYGTARAYCHNCKSLALLRKRLGNTCS